jgi:DnaJ-class molecular chaperone
MSAATYIGHPCRKCGSTARYVKRSKCRACALRYSMRKRRRKSKPDPKNYVAYTADRAARKKALAARLVTYIGHPCVRCEGTVRYTASHMCKPCKDSKSVAWQRANRELLNARMRERRRVAQMKRVQTVDAAGPSGTLTDRTTEREHDNKSAN